MLCWLVGATKALPRAFLRSNANLATPVERLTHQSLPRLSTTNSRPDPSPAWPSWLRYALAPVVLLASRDRAELDDFDREATLLNPLLDRVGGDDGGSCPCPW